MILERDGKILFQADEIEIPAYKIQEDKLAEYQMNAPGFAAHEEGIDTTASGIAAHSEGIMTEAAGIGSHAQGTFTKATTVGSHAEGSETIADAPNAHAEGAATTANGTSAHAEGIYSVASNANSHAEGFGTVSSGYTSHSEGFGAEALGDIAHAEGLSTESNAVASHAEGALTVVDGTGSHAEGIMTKAQGDSSHSEGYNVEAIGMDSHAEGNNTQAIGNGSHAQNIGTIAKGYAQTVIGLYNEVKGEESTLSEKDALFIIGNGNEGHRGNALEVAYNGDTEIYGSVGIGVSFGSIAYSFKTWGNEEIPRGYFVTLKGDKVRKAKYLDTYILGVTTESAGVLLGSNRLNDAGRSSENRVNVAMVGLAVVVDDGSCRENRYCRPNRKGIATRANDGYRVIQRISDRLVVIVLK